MNKVPISKILVFKRESDPCYSFIVVIIYLLEVGEFFFLVDAFRFQGRGEDGIVDTVVSCLSVVEAKTFFDANISFLWSELPDVYGIYVHSIWIFGLPSGGRGKVRAYGRRGGFVIFGLLRHDLVGSVPLDLEPLCFGIPFIDGGGYGVHGVNAMHKY